LNFLEITSTNIENELDIILAKQNKLRIAANNLIVYFQNPVLKAKYYNTLLKMISLIPSRTFWIERNNNVNTFSTSISASCSPEGCSEHIKFMIPENFTHIRLVTTIRSLLLPDIPLKFFFFSELLHEYKEFEIWHDLVDELIINSLHTQDLTFNNMKITDIAWVSINRYQNIVARYFDNKPIISIEKIFLTVSSDTNAKSQIVYFVAWLIEVLNLDMKSFNSLIFVNKNPLADGIFFKELIFQTPNENFVINLQEQKYPCGIIKEEEAFINIFEGNSSKKLFYRTLEIARSLYDYL